MTAKKKFGFLNRKISFNKYQAITTQASLSAFNRGAVLLPILPLGEVHDLHILYPQGR